ncbi:hypothetical protein LTR84_002728 [Exophiala bonariae]|uniref:Uncharacterized protein n=1 Tax=Exophiala bonariae TaxID=1690606 RepID=A0AAV9N8Q7_9EURO|nr:hypothetical protein LTR84_002728 [Exophiala bonariae]
MSRYAPVSHHPPAEFTSANFDNMNSQYPPYTNSSENIPLKSQNFTRVSEQSEPYNSMSQQSTWKEFNRTDTGSSLGKIASSPWEHKLNEKHVRGVPPPTDTTRYFDRGRQTRRVFLECLFMWFGTAFVCGALAGTMYGFSRITSGMSQFQKYGYNALVTGLSIVLGLAFAAQFKQYAEMMRWRFLASEYRSLQDFELVLGCDSYRNTLSLMCGGNRKGTWYPSKTQVIACFWFMVFVVFNVCAALLGLTYSIDVSETAISISPGNISVADLSYISGDDLEDNGASLSIYESMPAANLWGELGLSYQDSVYPVDGTNSSWKYTFSDYSSNPENKLGVLSTREVHSTSTCQEYKVTFGGFGNFNVGEDTTAVNLVMYEDFEGVEQSLIIENVAIGATSYIGNGSSVDNLTCGPRCAQVLILQTANNCTEAMTLTTNTTDDCFGVVPVPEPRLWTCDTNITDVLNATSPLEGFQTPEVLALPDPQAQIIAGATGWSGVFLGDSGLTQAVIFRGRNIMNAPGSAGAEGIAQLVMRFSVGVVAAIDQAGGPRQYTMGANSPGAAQIVNVKWKWSILILAGIPLVQFIMLIGVVWFSGKAVILEPSYMTAAHLLQPMLNKVGESGSLLSTDEMAERLGDYKIAYAVRPDRNDPGHSDTTFVRDLGIVEEAEGYGYIRGKMPEGRYD